MSPVIRLAFMLALIAPALIVQAQIMCSTGQPCPTNLPCCSQYGQCGIGAYCLGGCDPLSSNSLNSCVPAPVCASKNYTFSSPDGSSISGVVSNQEYLGDASKADWVSDGNPLPFQNNVLLTLSEAKGGTVLASTHYMWYGKTTAKFTTSAGSGVVTAFILLSDVKDEIDLEFVGVELTIAQTNFYSQGVTNYQNGLNATDLSDVHQNEHTYEIDWTPDQITWTIDGKEVRTKQRSDTWNETANRYDFPQTPARIQLSLWAAGLSSNQPGTIAWGGGLIDWNSQYMYNPGQGSKYYYASVSSVTTECYNPPSGANVQGSNSYIYTNAAATNNTVEVTNDNTILKSLLGSGTNMSADYPSAAATASSAASSSQVPTVPGQNGAGPGADGQRGSSDTGSGTSGSSGSGSGDSTTTGSGSASTGFIQGDGGSSGASPAKQETVLQGSLFAVLVAVAGLLVL